MGAGKWVSLFCEAILLLGACGSSCVLVRMMGVDDFASYLHRSRCS